MVFTAGAYKGVSHHYAPKLVAFEHVSDSSEVSNNLLLWIGGLGDGLLTVSYPYQISQNLPSGWSVAEVLLSSSYNGWGTQSLQSDVQELAQCVRYFRSIRNGKIVLMGHSTGCQDVMEYLVGPGHENRPAIDAGILQAPVSDREAMEHEEDPEQWARWVTLARKMVADDNGEEIVPGLPCSPCCARRWLSLASPEHDGDDDYFSSDLSDEQLQKSFGQLPKSTPISILYSGADEHMPSFIDKKSLLSRWTEIARSGHGAVDGRHSTVIDGATHNLQGDSGSIRGELLRRVIDFLSDFSR